MGIDPLAIAGEQRQLLLNRLLLVEAGLACVEQRFAQDSPLEGDGSELSVRRQRRHPSATANRLSRHHFREISACALHQKLRPLRGNPPSFRGKSPVPRKGPRSRPPGPAFRKMRVQASDNSYFHGHRWGLGEQKANQAPESHQFLAKVPAPRRRDTSVPAFRKMRMQGRGPTGGWGNP